MGGLGKKGEIEDEDMTSFGALKKKAWASLSKGRANDGFSGEDSCTARVSNCPH